MRRLRLRGGTGLSQGHPAGYPVTKPTSLCPVLPRDQVPLSPGPGAWLSLPKRVGDPLNRLLSSPLGNPQCPQQGDPQRYAWASVARVFGTQRRVRLLVISEGLRKERPLGPGPPGQCCPGPGLSRPWAARGSGNARTLPSLPVLAEAGKGLLSCLRLIARGSPPELQRMLSPLCPRRGRSGSTRGVGDPTCLIFVPPHTLGTRPLWASPQHSGQPQAAPPRPPADRPHPPPPCSARSAPHRPLMSTCPPHPPLCFAAHLKKTMTAEGLMAWTLTVGGQQIGKTRGQCVAPGSAPQSSGRPVPPSTRGALRLARPCCRCTGHKDACPRGLVVAETCRTAVDPWAGPGTSSSGSRTGPGLLGGGRAPWHGGSIPWSLLSCRHRDWLPPPRCCSCQLARQQMGWKISGSP